jgi:Tol biopolymer transport system component
MPLAAGSSLGPYQILGLIGEGGMGEVYRARDARLRRDVAIKVLPASVTQDADRLARFQREAQLLAALNCPNIAAIYGVEEAAGVRGLVLELVEGETLAERVAAGPLPVAEALAIARQIADALDAAHERGIVHRDLKPANIKVAPDGTVKVLDFGLAKGRHESANPDLSTSPTITSDGTRAGVILGTALYMSPEQARGQVIDKRTDIWAFGCVLYEMLTGRRPFGGATVSDVIASMLATEPDWTALPPGTPPLVRRLLPRLLAKDPRRRVRDIADARADLDESPAPAALPSAEGGARSVRAWRLTALAAIATLLAVAAAAWRGTTSRAMPPSFGLDRAVVTRLTNYVGTETSAAIAPDGRSFVFVSDRAGTPDIWRRQIAGGEPVRLTNDAPIESGVVFAPDGESVYFARADGTQTSIFRMLALGGQAQRVIGNALLPSPSPDGRLLAWYRLDEKGDFALFVSGSDGSNARPVAAVQVQQARGAWSRDSRRLAYSLGGLFTTRNVHVVDVASGEGRQVTHFSGSAEGPWDLAWLADDRHLIITYLASPGALRARDLGVLDIVTGVVSRLSSSLSDSFMGAPTLSADGTRLIVTVQRDEREVWRVPNGPDPEANGRAATRVLDMTSDPMWTFVSRDGRTLLFNNAVVGSRNLWTMPLDGSAPPKQITAIAGDAVMHSALSPDGARVAFASNTTGQSDIWVQNVDGSDLRQLTNDAGADAWPAWSPDGRSIMFSSQDGRETRRIPSDGGPAAKVIDGFFRGDWRNKPDGQGTWIATSMQGAAGLRVIDVERGTVLWHERVAGNAMPTFSPDGRSISHPYRESRDRDAIWIFDAATGKSRVAARFSEPFTMFFRAGRTDDGRAFIVNRYRQPSYTVMFDRLSLSGSGAP